MSIISQSVFFVGIGLDLIYGLGFGYPWQYILVDIIYFIFLSMQQIQMAKAKVCPIWIHTITFSWVLIISILAFYVYLLGVKVEGDAFSSIFNIGFWFAGYVSTIIWVILWLPQIAKNMFQKEADGYAKSFWVIGFTKTICDITTTIAFGYTWLNLFGGLFSLIVYIALISQTFYYRRNLKMKNILVN
ncbi:MAG: hypothetical protein ACJA0H_001856 [Francisellaceae bacterium]